MTRTSLCSEIDLGGGGHGLRDVHLTMSLAGSSRNIYTLKNVLPQASTAETPEKRVLAFDLFKGVFSENEVLAL